MDQTTGSGDEFAFLFTWDGVAWRDVVRLRPGR